jgi:hypothetical protein
MASFMCVNHMFGSYSPSLPFSDDPSLHLCMCLLYIYVPCDGCMLSLVCFAWYNLSWLIFKCQESLRHLAWPVGMSMGKYWIVNWCRRLSPRWEAPFPRQVIPSWIRNLAKETREPSSKQHPAIATAGSCLSSYALTSFKDGLWPGSLSQTNPPTQGCFG